MDISTAMQNNIKSLQSAVSFVTLKKAMNQDAQTMATLINDMQNANANIIPSGVGGVGGNLDVRA